MLDIGWSELLMVAVVAIIVVGPKDLPRALRTAGQWVGKVRGMAREFQSSVDDMIRDSELEDLKKEARAITDFDLEETLERQADPTGSDDGVFDAEALENFEAPVEPTPDYAADENMAPPHSLTPPVEAPTTEAEAPATEVKAPVTETEPEEAPEPTSNRASG